MRERERIVGIPIDILIEKIFGAVNTTTHWEEEGMFCTFCSFRGMCLLFIILYCLDLCDISSWFIEDGGQSAVYI